MRRRKSWKIEKVFTSGDEFFAEVLENITRAQSSIDVEVYIFDFDELGREILGALSKKVRSGVRARVLVDGIGSFKSISELKKYCERAQIDFRVYHPVSIQKIFHFLKRLNKRNHRKLWIFDATTAMVSSMNITSSHLARFRFNLAWRDFGVQVDGPEVRLIQRAFEKSWRSAGELYLEKRPEFAWPQLVLLNDTILRRYLNQRRWRHLIRSARGRVWLATPYFVPNISLYRALSRAARRGVDVRILVPKISDVFFIPWLTSAFYFGLIKSGVQVYEFQPTLFHGKIAILDDWYQVGSSNFNHRSFLHDLEIDIVLTQPQSQQTLFSELSRDFERSQLVTLQDLHNTSILKRILARFFLLFRYWS